MKKSLYLLVGLLILLAICFFYQGRILRHEISQTNYMLMTQKKIPNLKIALFSDSHLGKVFDANDFGRYLQALQKNNPDILFILGDYVDDITTKEQMLMATRTLGKIKTKYGIYFVFGNHDNDKKYENSKGFTKEKLIGELEKNGVVILQDKVFFIDDTFVLIGRQDAWTNDRKTMDDLLADVDKNKYMIVLDHQPTDFLNQEKSKVDLVLSGHTHGYMGKPDLLYGYKRINKTDFIITSGMSVLPSNAKPEFVIIDLKKK